MTELRFTKEGVPIFDGTSEAYVPYRRAALNYVETLEWKKRSLAGPRLQAALEGTARVAVQHKTPGWISHPEGAVTLLNFLKTRVQAPTLAEAGKMISRFFYTIKRRKGESMNAWILRHDEALYEARRTLAEAIQEYGIPESSRASTRAASITTRSPMEEVRSLHPADEEEPPGFSPFDDDGRMREEDEAPDSASHADWQWSQYNWWQGYSGRWWDQSSWQEWQPPRAVLTSSLGKYDVSDAASQEADRFLPDFVVAWMLLQRSGLDHNERGTIVANLRNKFTTDNVKSALKLAWPEDDLRRRDQQRGSALLIGDDDDEALLMDDDEWTAEDTALMTEDDQQAYAHVCSDVESALQAYNGARRTLRDARERQSNFRKSRQFFPMKKESFVKKETTTTPVVKCFKCGGNHATSDCRKTSNSTPGAVHLAFSVSGVLEPSAMAFTSDKIQPEQAEPTEIGLSLSKIVAEGKAIVDGGATSSVGSVSALDQILALQTANQFPCSVEVETEDQPQFRFGNNGRTKCLSTTHLGVPLNGASSSMKIHVHDIHDQPVLLSVSALRSLKAVIDFERDEMVLKAVDPSRVVKLEQTPSGHQLFPLAGDIMKDSQLLSQPFHSFCTSKKEE